MDGERPEWLKSPAEYGWSIGKIGPDELLDAKPTELETVETMMVIARNCRDADGKMVLFTLPPAVALAFIRTFSVTGGPELL